MTGFSKLLLAVDVWIELCERLVFCPRCIPALCQVFSGSSVTLAKIKFTKDEQINIHKLEFIIYLLHVQVKVFNCILI